ncbi:hypothetical protein [Vibrio coralliirubri]|uniref:hypothetical protein n=1 Tax=Vibrio coralliirubri TaxID=1516159 RepID=UPI000A3D34DB|nr:hypothetical protein [Vibrio coralliirubri]
MHDEHELALDGYPNLELLPFIIPQSTDITNAAFTGTGVLSGNVTYKYHQLATHISEVLTA